MILYLVRKWLRKQLAQGNLEDVMYELVEASKEVWYEDNIYTVEKHLKDELDCALAYSYQILLP